MELRHRGYFFWKAHWYSICSKHFHWDPECDQCQHGMWVYDLAKTIDSWVYRNHYWLWYGWHNRSNLKPPTGNR